MCCPVAETEEQREPSANEEQAEPSASQSASDEDDKPVAPPKLEGVTRTPLRPAGEIRETPREVAIGLLAGLVMFGGGARIVYWAFVRWLTRGGSSTVLAASVLLPVALPLMVGAIVGERGRKPLGYSMVVGVMIGLTATSVWAFTKFAQSNSGAGPGMSAPLPSMPR
jgi:hypothetical protein